MHARLRCIYAGVLTIHVNVEARGMCQASSISLLLILETGSPLKLELSVLSVLARQQAPEV